MSKARVAATAPIAVDVEQGREYWWCACGLSRTQPFCDGSHKPSALRPLQYIAGETGTLFFCGCKQSAQPPLCDGSHKKLSM